MSPVKDSQNDHWKRKISWKYHFQAKPDIILPEKIIRGSAVNAWKGVLGGAPATLGVRDVHGLRRFDLKIAMDNCPDPQQLPVAQGAPRIDHD